MTSTGTRAAELRTAILACLHRQGLRRAEGLLVALSGGPDSVAMLHGLWGLPASRRPRLVAAYVDHGLRPSAERARERSVVRQLCARMTVPLIVQRLPPGGLATEARRAGRSLEEQARVRRYELLRQAARQAGCARIAVGHTADDQAETVLMRLLQGWGVEALAGIPERRGAVVRPLLGCTRQAVLRHLAESGLPSHRDSSNASPRFLRNALRLRLLPLLEEVAPGFRGTLARLSGQFAQARELLEGLAAERLPWQAAGAGFVLDYDRFLAAPPLLRAVSLRRQLRVMGLGARKVPQRFLEAAAQRPQEARGATLLAGYGVRLLRRGASLVLQRDIVGGGEKGYFIACPRGGRLAVPAAGLCFDFGDPAAAGSRPDRVLVLRSRRPGDRLRIESGVKSVDKILSEWRVPREDRWKVPVAEDRHGVVAILGRALGFRDRYRQNAVREVGLSIRRRPRLPSGEKE